MRQVVTEREAVQTVVMGAASPPDREGVRQALHYGVRGAFGVLSTHYDLDLEAVAREAFDSTFTLEEIQEVLVRIGPAVDQLAATMEEKNRRGH